MGLFQSSLTPEEKMAECQTMLRVQVRSLERSRDKLDERCDELKERAKELAQDGKLQEAQLNVKQIIRFRGASLKLTGVVMKIEDMVTSVELTKSTAYMQRAMVQMTHILVGLNDLLPNRDLERVIHDFQRASEQLDENQKSVDNAIDASMEQFDNPVDEQQLYQQVCDEIGIDIALPNTFAKKNGKDDEDDLIARMNKLKN
jgi:soluble cytochrome b562